MTIEKPNIDSARRNLMIISSLMILIEMAGADIQAINLPGASVTLQNPEFIYYFCWIVLIYTTYRFYLVAKGNYIDFRQSVTTSIVRSDFVQNAATKLMASMYPSGVKFSDLYIEKSLFSRVLHVNVQDDKQLMLGHIEAPISFIRVFCIGLKASIASCFRSADFFEFNVPLIVACSIPLYKLSSFILAVFSIQQFP